MEAKNLRILESTDVLNKGDLENVTVSDDRILLDSVAGRHVLYGCYTSIPIPMPRFDALVMSWNADTPAGTAVEAQARVLIDDNWSQWVGFGRWSPTIKRRSTPMAKGSLKLPREVLYLDEKTATQVQLRIYLYTDDETVTPSVWMLAASVRGTEVAPAPSVDRIGSRQLRVPAYSQLLRAPALVDGMALSSCLAGMMNRYGEDVLPEELALAMYDWEDHSSTNLAFGCAVSGCWGYRSHLAFMDLNELWAEVRAGNAVTAEISYAAVSQDVKPGCPLVEAALQTVESHPVVVTGFVREDSGIYVCINDPLAHTDAQAAQQLPLEVFAEAWDGIGLLLYRKQKTRGRNKPKRRMVTLHLNKESTAEGNYLLYLNGKPHPLPLDFCGTAEEPTGVLAATYADGIARATTAHKAFRFVNVVEGGIHLTRSGEKIKRTVYAIDATGSMLVGDIVL